MNILFDQALDDWPQFGAILSARAGSISLYPVLDYQNNLNRFRLLCGISHVWSGRKRLPGQVGWASWALWWLVNGYTFSLLKSLVDLVAVLLGDMPIKLPVLAMFIIAIIFKHFYLL